MTEQQSAIFGGAFFAMPVHDYIRSSSCLQFGFNSTLRVGWKLNSTLDTPTFFIATSAHITTCTGLGRRLQLSLPGKLNSTCCDPGFMFLTANTEGRGIVH